MSPPKSEFILNGPLARAALMMLNQHAGQRIQVRSPVLAGDDEAEVTFFRSAGVSGERRENAGGKQPAFQGVRFPPAARNHRNDGSGMIRQRVSSLPQAAFEVI